MESGKGVKGVKGEEGAGAERMFDDFQASLVFPTCSDPTPISSNFLQRLKPKKSAGIAARLAGQGHVELEDLFVRGLRRMAKLMARAKALSWVLR